MMGVLAACMVAGVVMGTPKMERARETCVRGWSRYYESRLVRAGKLWEKALALHPFLGDARRGLTRLAREDLVLSREQLYARTIRQLYETGMRAYRRRAWREAKEWLTKAVALAPSHRQLRSFLNEVRRQLGEAVEDVAAPVARSAPVAATLHARVVQAVRPRPRRPASRPKMRRPFRPAKPAPRPFFSAMQIEAMYRQGFKAYRKGKRKEALRVWRLVLQADPLHTKARKNVLALERVFGPASRKAAR